MQITSLSPTKLKQGRLCRARLAAKYDKASSDGYEEEQGDLAKVGTLAHEAAKVWYRGGYNTDPDTGLPCIKGDASTWKPTQTADEAFKVAIALCHAQKDYNGNENSQVPNNPRLLEESRTLFEQIAAFYPRDKVKVVFVERKYKGMLPNGVPVSLIIDLGLDLGDGRLGIIDYKTGYITLNDDEIKEEDQVLMNLLATTRDPELAAFPIKQFQYYWVRDSYQSKPFSLDEPRLADYEMWLAMEWQSILNDNNPKEEINRFCYSCGRRKECKKYAEYMSEAYGGLKLPDKASLEVDLIQLGVPNPGDLAGQLIDRYSTVKDFTTEEVATFTEDDLMARFDRMGSQIKLLERNKDVLNLRLKSAMELIQAKELEGVKHKVKKISNVQSNMDVAIVIEMCRQYGIKLEDVFSISTSKVKTKFAQYPDAITHIQNTAHKMPMAAWLKVSAMTPKKVAAKRGKKKTEEGSAEQPAASTTAAPQADQF